MPADKRVAGPEHEREAPPPVQQPADAGVEHALDEHVDGFAVPAEAGLEHRETGLHAEHEERAEQNPAGVDRIDQVPGDHGLVRVGGLLSEHGVPGRHADENRAAEDDGEERHDSHGLASEQQHSVLPPLRVVQPRTEA